MSFVLRSTVSILMNEENSPKAEKYLPGYCSRSAMRNRNFPVHSHQSSALFFVKFALELRLNRCKHILMIILSTISVRYN